MKDTFGDFPSFIFIFFTVILFSPSESSTTEAQLVDSRAHLSDG